MHIDLPEQSRTAEELTAEAPPVYVRTCQPPFLRILRRLWTSLARLFRFGIIQTNMPFGGAPKLFRWSYEQALSVPRQLSGPTYI